MPYIKQERRDLLNGGETLPNGPGDLNYQITMLIKHYYEDGPKNYQAINDIVGALECSKLEFVRRVVNDYENSKIKENGDCY